MEDSVLDEFQSEIKQLAEQLADAFETDKVRFHYNAESESLYIELGGLDSKSEQEIEALAESILNECDLDMEEILLLPYADAE